MADAGARIPLRELDDMIRASNGRVYGFIFSTAVYDELRKRLDRLEGGNSYMGIAFIVDPSLADTVIDVAFTREAWSKRLKEIDDARTLTTPTQTRGGSE